MDETEPVFEQVPLQRSRPLTGSERALIEFLLADASAPPELRTQINSALVVATCSCGCPSVWLEVDPSAPSDRSAGHSAFTANQRKSRGSTQVTLHVVEGRLFELEVWGHRPGLRPRVDISKLERS